MLITLAALLAVYALLGFLWVPTLIRDQLEGFADSTLKRPIIIGEIRFNPFKLDASIGGLELTEIDGAPLLGFRHLYVNAQLASVWRQAIVLRELAVSAPRLHVRVAADGTVNLAQLIPASSGEESSAPLSVRIGHLAVREGSVAIEDAGRSFNSTVEPIRFTLTDFRTDPNHENAYQFAGRTLSGEILAWSGRFSVRPKIGSDGDFSVRGLKAATIDSYLGSQLPFRLASGALNLHGRYGFSLDPLDLKLTLPSLSIRDLALAERSSPGSAPVRMSAVELTDSSFSLRERRLGIRGITLNGAQFDIAREMDGSINLQKLLAPQVASQPQEEPAAADGETWTVSLDALRVDAATIRVEDRSVLPTAKFALAPVDVSVDGYSTDGVKPVRIVCDATVDDGGRFRAEGTVALPSLAGEIAFDLQDFALPSLQTYLSQPTTLTLHSGTLSARGTVFLANADSKPRGAIKGDVRVANVRATDQATSEDLVKWRDVNIDGIDAQLDPNRLRIERIVARQPYARVVIARDTSVNISRVFKPAIEEPVRAESPPATQASWPVAVDTVQVVDGSANFADYSIQPSFATGIVGLNGSIAGLSTKPTSRARVTLAGSVDRYAPVDIKGEVNLLSAALYTDLTMQFRNMELTTFNPYSGKFAGYNISKGKLSTDLKYAVENRKLDASHHIVLDNLEFGDKTDSKDAAPIPIKFAVALLKDRNGVIDVNLPVAGTLDDPTFRLGPIIWKAVLGLLTKVATAPFAALGALFGGGEELAFVDFPTGSAELASSERDKLTKLSAALVERPQLRLDVPLTVLNGDDAKAIAEQRFSEHAVAGDSNQDQQQRFKLLEAAYKSNTGNSPAYPPELLAKDDETRQKRLAWLQAAVLESLMPSPTELDELARTRAQAVQSTLISTGAIDPQRVFITTNREAAKSPQGLVRMEMKLE